MKDDTITKKHMACTAYTYEKMSQHFLDALKERHLKVSSHLLNLELQMLSFLSCLEKQNINNNNAYINTVIFMALMIVSLESILLSHPVLSI